MPKFKCDILSNFQTMWYGGFLNGFQSSVRLGTGQKACMQAAPIINTADLTFGDA